MRVYELMYGGSFHRLYIVRFRRKIVQRTRQSDNRLFMAPPQQLNPAA